MLTAIGTRGWGVPSVPARGHIRREGPLPLRAQCWRSPLGVASGPVSSRRVDSGSDASLMSSVIVVAVGGVVGALARWAVDLALPWAGGIPWATLLVNVLGCLTIGLMAARAAQAAWWVRPLVVTGVLGGFTTMSALALETFALARDGEAALAIAALALSIGGGLAAAALGARMGVRR